MAAKKIEYTFYKGQFRSQFSLGDNRELAAGSKMHDIILEPKFQLFNTQVITEEEFEKQIRCNSVQAKCECKLHSRADYHVVRLESTDFIEVFPGFETKGGKLSLTDSLAVFYTYEGLLTNKDVGGFYSKEGNSGKFTGEAFVRVVEHEEAVKEALLLKTRAENPIYRLWKRLMPTSESGKGCFNRKANIAGSKGGSGGSAGSGGSQEGGCFNRPIPFLGGGCFGGPRTMGGCFNAAQQPGGCFSMGWLGRVLGLLALLGLLLYLLSLLKSCDRTSGDRVVYVHDTGVGDVIKERVDTIEVVRIDTTKFLKTNKTKTTDVVELPNVQFETDKDILVPGSLPDIQKLAEFLIKNKHVNAEIYGHTDNVGDRQHNLGLSERRADAVKKLLVSLGVESSRIKTKGYGPDRPKNKNETPEGRLMNRRVEVRLTNMVSQTEETVEVKEL